MEIKHTHPDMSIHILPVLFIPYLVAACMRDSTKQVAETEDFGGQDRVE